MKQKKVYFVVCGPGREILSIPYWSRPEANEGLKKLRGDYDGRGPLKPHDRACFKVAMFAFSGSLAGVK